MLPLDALSLASAVIQIVDFASKLLTETKNVVKSGANALPQNELLLTGATRSSDLADDIAKLNLDAQPQNKNEAKLCELATACQKDSEDLAAYLGNFMVATKPDGRTSKMSAFSKVIKTKYRRSEIEDKQSRLQNSRSQLSDQLLFCIGDGKTKGFEELKDLVDRHAADSVTAVLVAKDQLMTRIEARTQEVETKLTKIEDLLLSDQDRKHAQIIIETLRYPNLDSRRSAIDEPHNDTFNWIFEATGSSFKVWLESDRGVFWVSGHAGTGKSTLMKFLRSTSETRNILQAWASPQPLLVLEHYFWVAGGPLERSEEGLLRSLLHQAFSAYPKLVQMVCVDRWDAVTSSVQQHPWTYKSLLTTLLKVRDLGLVKICLFVDGLDECESRMHRQLLRDLSEVCDGQNMKACLSSRPWEVFEQTLRISSDMLQLQDLTRHDVLRMVCDRLSEASPVLFPSRLCEALMIEDKRGYLDPLAKQAREALSDTEREAWLVIQDIVHKAEGVLLWLSMVLDNLCERIQSGATLQRLRSLVDQFPARLEEYFEQRILERISPTYGEGKWSETAMILYVAIALHKSLEAVEKSHWPHVEIFSSLLVYWTASRILEGDARFAQAEVYEYDTEVTCYNMGTNAANVIRDTGRYLRGCVRDVLRIHIDPRETGLLPRPHHQQVGFWHRTAFDFLTSIKMQSILLERIPSCFQATDFVSRLLFLSLKIVMANPTAGNLGDAVQFLAKSLADMGVAPAVRGVDRIMAERVMSDWPPEDASPSEREAIVNLGSILVCEGYQQFTRAVLDSQPDLITGHKFFRHPHNVAVPHLITEPCGLTIKSIPSPSETLPQSFSSLTVFEPPRVYLNFLELLLSKGCSTNVAMIGWSTVGSVWHQLLKTWYLQSSSTGEWSYYEDEARHCRILPIQCDVFPSMVLPLATLLIKYGADLQELVCVAPGSCIEGFSSDVGSHSDHERYDVATILLKVLPLENHEVMLAMLAEYTSAEKRESLKRERRERIKDHRAEFLNDEDRVLLGFPTRAEEGRQQDAGLRWS